jgi:methionyl aminopeptidase
MDIEIKTPEQIAVMREAGLVVARTLQVLAAAVRPGITTADLDALAEAEIRAAGATGSFKGYHGYPATICTSVNEEIVHGIPSRQRSLRDGDIVSIDCGAIVGGWHGDAALTVGVGAISAEHAGLLQACETALWRGIAQARAGGRLGDISHAVETSVGASGRYGVVEEYTGHGIGSAMHLDPPVPNYGRAGRGPRLRPGMALAIEPMVMLGSSETVLLDDGWTVVTADGSWAAHFEHTVAITPDGPWVLTQLAGRATPQDPPDPGGLSPDPLGEASGPPGIRTSAPRTLASRTPGTCGNVSASCHYPCRPPAQGGTRGMEAAGNAVHRRSGRAG